MKTASGALLSLINGSQQFVMADLYTITLVGGSVLRYTDADIAIAWNANTFLSVPISRSAVREIIGTEVDTLDMTLFFGVNDLILGLPYPRFVQNGGFDGATVQLEKAFLSDWATAPVGTIIRFTGRISDAKPSRSQIDLTVKSYLELLNIQMPRNLYQPSCQHALFDGGCTLNKASFAANTSVSSGSSATQLLCGLVQAAGYFDQGTITFTSGANNGISRTVKSQTAGVLNLSIGLPAVPSVGDTFMAYPGDDKQLSTCINKFNNKVNFKGFPYVPVPETAL